MRNNFLENSGNWVQIFVCTNKRNNQRSCAGSGSELLLDYARSKFGRALSANGGIMRINRSGCLGQCHNGPVLVVYPEGKYYTIESTGDIDEIIATHLHAIATNQHISKPNDVSFNSSAGA